MTVTLAAFTRDFTPEERARVAARTAELVEEELTHSLPQVPLQPGRGRRAGKEVSDDEAQKVRTVRRPRGRAK